MVRSTLMPPQELAERLARPPRVRLATLPTPLEECSRLRKALGEPPIFIKRDDLTGLALGGNKVRHLEFRLGYALAHGYDAFIYVDRANAARVTAAACAKVGMRCILVLKNARHYVPQGNILLEHLLGAELVFLETKDKATVPPEVHAMAEELSHDGWKPFVLQDMPVFHTSALCSYMLCAMELADQLTQAGAQEARIFVAAGHSQAGLQLAAKVLGLPWKVTGIAVGQGFEPARPQAEWTEMLASLLALPISLAPSEVDTDFHYAGKGYDAPTQESVDAVKLVARTEGILLDPVYTGKTMAAAIDCIRSGRVEANESVVFVHTGGIPIIFEQADSLASDIARLSLADVKKRM